MKSNFKEVINSAKTFQKMAVNVNVNGANLEMMKRVFQSFVKLAVKKKKKNKME